MKLSVNLSVLEITSIVQTVFQAPQIIIGSLVAYASIEGLNVWKKQLKGNQDYNLARSLLNNLYKYRCSGLIS